MHTHWNSDITLDTRTYMLYLRFENVTKLLALYNTVHNLQIASFFLFFFFLLNTQMYTYLTQETPVNTSYGTRLGVIPYSARNIVSSMRSDLIWNCFYSETLIKILCHLLKYCLFVTLQHNNESRKKVYNLFIPFFFLLSYLLKRSSVQQRLRSERRSCMTFFSSYWKPLYNLFFIWRVPRVSGLCRDLGEAEG